jgi:hypothetical protein
LKCRFCGTEIAEKALICYRCGKATTDPVVSPPQTESLFAKRRRSKMPFVIGAIVLIIVALLLVWFVLGMGARSGRIGDVSRTRVGAGAGPIIEAWLFASCSSASWPPRSSSVPCRTARWQTASAATSRRSAPRSPVSDRRSV